MTKQLGPHSLDEERSLSDVNVNVYAITALARYRIAQIIGKFTESYWFSDKN